MSNKPLKRPHADEHHSAHSVQVAALEAIEPLPKSRLIVEAEPQAKERRSVPNAIHRGDNHGVVLALKLFSRVLKLDGRPAHGQLGMERKPLVVEKQIAKAQPGIVVNKRNGGVAVGHHNVADVFLRTEGVVFGRHHIVVVHHPVEAKRHLRSHFVGQNLPGSGVEPHKAATAKLLSRKERRLAGGVFFHHLRSGRLAQQQTEKK